MLNATIDRSNCPDDILKARGHLKHTWHPVLLILAALTLSALSLKVLPAPFVWVDLIWALALFGGILCLHHPWHPAVALLLFNSCIMAAALASGELYLTLREVEPPTYSDGYRVKDDILGSAPIRGTQARSTRSEGGVTLYDVRYTIDSKGLRVAPPVKNGGPAGCILFFGDSFTFGEGLQDTETLPYQVGIQSGGQYQTFNFGFHGYGPHQMLAQIEHGLVRKVVDCHPQYAIYQALPHHIARVAGKVLFGQHAPRYQLGIDGTMHRNGHFDDEKKVSSPLEKEIRWQLSKSAIYRFLENLNGNKSVSQDDIRLLLAIVRNSRDALTVQYPAVKFHVILWQVWKEESEIFRELRDGFRQINIPVHLMKDILPGYTVDSPNYVLSMSDRHPNARANQILANYVLTTIASSEAPNPAKKNPPM